MTKKSTIEVLKKTANRVIVKNKEVEVEIDDTTNENITTVSLHGERVFDYTRGSSSTGILYQFDYLPPILQFRVSQLIQTLSNEQYCFEWDDEDVGLKIAKLQEEIDKLGWDSFNKRMQKKKETTK
tara:strand:- start:112 stop:489 length:378 start_codon:yes stop_codon:yes gene_type:complete